jgi:hypothetical protein
MIVVSTRPVEPLFSIARLHFAALSRVCKLSATLCSASSSATCSAVDVCGGKGTLLHSAGTGCGKLQPSRPP